MYVRLCVCCSMRMCIYMCVCRKLNQQSSSSYQMNENEEMWQTIKRLLYKREPKIKTIINTFMTH